MAINKLRGGQAAQQLNGTVSAAQYVMARSKRKTPPQDGYRLSPGFCITTVELARRMAGGDDYIRTRHNQVIALALNTRKNPKAPSIIVVGKGPRIEARAKRFLDSGVSVPCYLKRDTDAWELVGNYRARRYATDEGVIRRHFCGGDISAVAGILFLERTDEVTDIEVAGGGFSDSATRRAVEQAAIEHVWAQFEAQGYEIHDRQHENLGYDLLAVSPGATLMLEVKGTDGPVARFFLTRNERRCATCEPSWRLAVVSSARTVPRMDVFTWRETEAAYRFDPLAWECTPLP